MRGHYIVLSIGYWLQQIGLMPMGRLYNAGDRVGEYNVLLLRDIETTSYGHRICEFLCPVCEKETFIAKLYHVTSGKIRQCKKCRSKARSGENSVNFKDLLGKKFGKLTAIEYAGNHVVGNNLGKPLTRSVWKCLCDCGNICYKDTNVLLRGLAESCGCCGMKSKGEWRIKEILNKSNIKFEQQYRFEDCVNIHPLPFDFYLPEYNICIEYDGTSHYVPNVYGSWNTEESVKNTQYRDSIKNKYCEEHGINLIRIPYWDYDKLSEDYLMKLIENAKNDTPKEMCDNEP